MLIQNSTSKIQNSNEPFAKKENIRQMFDNISKHYDFLNHFLSLGIDKIWRRKIINIIRTYNHKYILDIATGSGDLAIGLAALKPEKINGIDISTSMLKVAEQKVNAKNLNHIIELREGDAENTLFPDNTFDVVTIAFGIRNFEHTEKALTEIKRILNNEGVLAILEFSKPTVFPVKQLFQLYFHLLLPLIGRLISKSENAYSYLPKSVSRFPEGEAFLTLLRTSGFQNCYAKRLSFGIASIYIAEK